MHSSLLIFATAVSLCFSTAQQSPASQGSLINIVGSRDRMDVRVEQAEVRAVLDELFAVAKESHDYVRPVKGKVTLLFKSVDFETVLKNTLRQVDATYVLDKGVYKIYGPDVPLSQSGAHIKVSAEGDRMSVDIYRADVREALRQVFSKRKFQYSIDPDVQGMVSLSYVDASFDDVVSKIVEQVDATALISQGVIRVSRKDGDAVLHSGHGNLPTQTAVPQSALTVDDKFLYLVRGNQIYKIDKVTLKTVAQGQLKTKMPLHEFARMTRDLGIEVRIDPRLKSLVYLPELEEVAFSVALRDVVKQANATYIVKGGVYYIQPKPRR